MLDELLAAGPDRLPFEHERLRADSSDGAAERSARAARLVAWLLSPESDGVSGRLISAQWDDWQALGARCEELQQSDIYTLRRIGPGDRGKDW
jgi:3-oxoacyl-[acyl-carrier protein] reductase